MFRLVELLKSSYIHIIAEEKKMSIEVKISLIIVAVMVIVCVVSIVRDNWFRIHPHKKNHIDYMRGQLK